MAPGITVDEATRHDLPGHAKPGEEVKEGRPAAAYPAPLELSGALDGFAHEEATPAIGREYPGVNIVDDLLGAANADELIRDLAITISQRGVVFFRAQDNLTDSLQKQLVHRLGQLSGKPAESTLHTHPILNGTSSEFGLEEEGNKEGGGGGAAPDPQISTISSVQRRRLFRHEAQPDRRRYDSAQWHSDIQFEPAPADYTSLRLTRLPRTGGDTLWASGYDLLSRCSPAYRRFLEGLTATFVGDGFLRAAEADPGRVRVHAGPRGHPANAGAGLRAVHPVVRTNPVTGWKSLFAVGPFPKVVNELNPGESAELLERFKRAIVENHDLQVRFKWRNKNDLAIWDNRSVFHTATFDYEGLGERFGHRAVGIGELPYLDPNSVTKAEALGEE